ncbi:MAG: 3-isopropylmalate dehydrogenase [Flavobacteriales bacterium]|jgi:3-isopropylmalate dehydrogenase|nr:3-isopropylmalate dehydrogenase [Flavobacteriales bacterium]
MKLKIAVLSGDGIGPEVCEQGVKVLKAIEKKFKHQFTFVDGHVGGAALDTKGVPLPDETLDICLNADAILFGAIGDPKFENSPDVKIRPEEGLLKLRKELGLFANIRPLKVFEPLVHKSPIKEKVIKNTDFIIFRELTGGIYYGEKSTSSDGNSAMDTSHYSIEEIDRVAHMAFKSAKSRRKKLTLIDKANVLETSRLWRKRVKELAKQYPDVDVNYLYVDNAAMKIIVNPRQFDVILTENLFGDIISDEASVISGSIGLLASTSIGEKSVLFEPIHGSFPEMKGKNLANPLATILSTALLLEHFKLYEEADAIKNAVEKSIEHHITTPDINSTKKFAHTSSVGDFISEYINDKKNILYYMENISLGQSTII